MDKHLEQEEQFYNDAPVSEEEYSLEDIMREFGSWTTPPEPASKPDPAPALAPEPTPEPEPVPEAQSSAEPAQQLPAVMRVAAEQREKPRFKITDLSGDTIRFGPVTEEDAEEEPPAPSTPVEMPEEPPIPEAELLRAQKREEKRRRRLESQERRAQRAAEKARKREEPEIVYPSPEDACADYAKAGTLRIRLMTNVFLTIASAVLLCLASFPVGGLDLTGSTWGLSVAMLALLLVQSLLTAEVFLRGIYQALRLKFDLMSLLTVTVLVTVADAFFAIPAQRLPFCTAPALMLLLALWSITLEKRAKWRTLKTVLSMDAPVAAVKEEKAWHGLDCIFRREGSLQDFTAMLETPDAAQKAMRVYAPLMLVVTAGLAVFAAIQGGSNFLWAWAALLSAALPAGAFLSCARPFALLARRLNRAGAAICGWRGAKILSGEGGIVIEDADLFPKSNISMNGMKMYSDMPIRQVVGYATAVLQAAGSGLVPLFEEVMKSENGRRYSADSFRQYEGGGLGAEIRGDVVLLGSLPFMRLMGVHVPEGTRVQSAVYISVNQELVGVFALTYAPASTCRAGLTAVLRSPGLTPVLATRDFMITPALVKKRYKISTDRLEFPVVAERARLSSQEAGEHGRQGALMARDSFVSFAAAVTGGRQLRRTVHGALVLSILSGILGTALMCILTYLDSTASASALNLLLYQLLWQVPTLMVTGFVGKS